MRPRVAIDQVQIGVMRLNLGQSLQDTMILHPCQYGWAIAND